MKILVPVKRVVDYNVKVRVKADGTGTLTAASAVRAAPASIRPTASWLTGAGAGMPAPAGTAGEAVRVGVPPPAVEPAPEPAAKVEEAEDVGAPRGGAVERGQARQARPDRPVRRAG